VITAGVPSLPSGFSRRSACRSSRSILCVWLIYTLDLPNELAFGMVPLGLVGLNACRRRLAADTRDPLVRSLLVGQAAVLVWNLAWLAVVLSYSGQALLPFRTPPLLRSPTSC
jgi:hypothetical protein